MILTKTPDVSLSRLPKNGVFDLWFDVMTLLALPVTPLGVQGHFTPPPPDFGVGRPHSMEKVVFWPFFNLLQVI